MSTGATYDPAAESSNLRDHLSTFDRAIVLLVGAGASAAVKSTANKPLVPTVAGMTAECKLKCAELGDWASNAWDSIVASRAARQELSDSSTVTIEDVLTNLRERVSSMSEDDTSAGASLHQLQELETTITNVIVNLASPEEILFPLETPHDALARWIGRLTRSDPVEIFTTNYDLVLERALERQSVPLFDGFVGSREPFFSPASLVHRDAAPGRAVTRLWKVHGSVNWKLVDDPGGGLRVVRSLPGDRAHLILPSSMKYDQSRKLPYIAILDRLTRALTEREDALVVAIGCGFADQHINEILIDALVSRPKMHLLALQYVDPEPGDAIWSMALAHPNVLVYGPSRAIVGSNPGNWQLVEPVTDRNAEVIDPIFDSNGVVEIDQPELLGRFRLGDFEWFAKFLDEITVARA